MFLETISHQNIDRTYYLFIFSGYKPDRPTPLLLVFHGGVGQGNIMAVKTGFNKLAERDGFIVVYPNGINRDSGGQWNDGRNSFNQDPIDDVSFVISLIEQISKDWNINSRRIYAVGGSNGGFFTQRLACEIPDRFAAAASIAATLPRSLQSRCQYPQKSIPILMINGTNDKLVPWRGGKITIREDAEILSVPQTLEFWRTHNDCFDDVKRELIAEQKIVKTEYLNGHDNVAVVHYAIRGGGHGWPGGNIEPLLENVTRNGKRQVTQQVTRLRQRLVGNINQDINASEITWQFLREYTL